MVLTDLFGENVDTNVRILYVPIQDKIADITEHINPGAKDFSDIDICIISVGQHDLETRLSQFISDYKKMINALRVHNAKMYLFILLVLPIGPRQDLHKFTALKSQQLKENLNRKAMGYVNSFANLSIQGEVLPEFFRNHKLNRGGMKRFFQVASKAILSLAK